MIDWGAIRDAPRDRPLRLYERGVRLGQWDEQRQRWVSTIDPQVVLYPTHWRPMPTIEVQS